MRHREMYRYIEGGKRQTKTSGVDLTEEREGQMALGRELWVLGIELT